MYILDSRLTPYENMHDNNTLNLYWNVSYHASEIKILQIGINVLLMLFLNFFSSQVLVNLLFILYILSFARFMKYSVTKYKHSHCATLFCNKPTGTK